MLETSSVIQKMQFINFGIILGVALFLSRYQVVFLIGVDANIDLKEVLQPRGSQGSLRDSGDVGLDDPTSPIASADKEGGAAEPGSVGLPRPSGEPGATNQKGKLGVPRLVDLLVKSGKPGAKEKRVSVSAIMMPTCLNTCEGDTARMDCKSFEGIKIMNVYWGRNNATICPKIPPGLSGKYCDADQANALRKVKGQCLNEISCVLPATNVFFDDNTCGNTFKFLKVCYNCAPLNEESLKS